MNIAGGASFSSPYWQTDTLRLGVLGAPVASDGSTRYIRLSCGTQVVAACSPAAQKAGAQARVRRTPTGWQVERLL